MKTCTTCVHLSALCLFFTESNKWFTIYPSNTDGLKDSKSKKSHSTTGVIVKKLEDIQATLSVKQKNKKLQTEITVTADVCVFFLQTTIFVFSFVTLTSVTISRPTRKLARLMKRRRNLRRCPIWKKEGYISEIAVTRASWYTNWYINRKSFRVSILWYNELNIEKSSVLLPVFTSLSSPRNMIMIKKKIAHNWGKGIIATARG